MEVKFTDLSGTTGSCHFTLDDSKCIEFALEYHEEQLIKIPRKPTNRLQNARSASSRLGLTEGTMSEFNGSIRTAKNDDASVEYTVRGSDFKVVYYSGSDQSSLDECEHGSTGDTHDHVR